MFRSIFSKYFLAFMLLIVMSFLMLSAIITSMVANYSTAEKESLLKKSLEGSLYAVNTYMSEIKVESFSKCLDDAGEKISGAFGKLSQYDKDIVIFISDLDGNLLLADNLRTPPNDIHVPTSYINDISLHDGEVRKYTREKVKSFLPHTQIALATSISDNDGNTAAVLFICSTSDEYSDFVDVVFKTVMLSSLWVVLSAVVAIYFITERIVGPMRAMNRAAKDFTRGKFNVHIPVVGQDEVAELATAFNQMAKSLKDIEVTQQTFLGNVSHDLRTPMTTISGYIDSILDGAIPPDKYSYYLDIISTEIKRLSRLVNEILDVSKIRAGERQFSMEPFDVCEKARLVLISLENEINEKHLDIEFKCKSDNMYVRADPDAIHQALYNICENAAKFANPGGKLSINIFTKGDKVHVKIFNEGNGIPAEDLPHIFERFYKGDKSRSLDKKGTGLGLYIAKTIIDAHGENIECRSEYGKYCEFEITLQSTPNIQPHRNKM